MWSDSGFVFEVELLKVVDRLHVICENKRIIEGNS